MLRSFDLSSVRTEEPWEKCSPERNASSSCGMASSDTFPVSGLSDQRRSAPGLFLQESVRVIDETWCMACPVAAVVKHRKDGRVGAEVDPCRGHGRLRPLACRTFTVTLVIIA